jgi:hypothetical protein
LNYRPLLEVRSGYTKAADALIKAYVGPDHGIGHFGFLKSMLHAHRGGLSGAGGTSTTSKIAANIDCGF